MKKWSHYKNACQMFIGRDVIEEKILAVLEKCKLECNAHGTGKHSSDNRHKIQIVN